MTPLEFAKVLAKELDALLLPDPVHAQLGDIVVDCQGTTISVMNVSEQNASITSAGGICDVVEMADIIAIAARECADVSNDDGTTDHDAMDAVSATMDADGTILLDWADQKLAEAFFRLGRPTLIFTIQGAIAFVTLSVTLPIP